MLRLAGRFFAMFRGWLAPCCLNGLFEKLAPPGASRARSGCVLAVFPLGPPARLGSCGRPVAQGTAPLASGGESVASPPGWRAQAATPPCAGLLVALARAGLCVQGADFLRARKNNHDFRSIISFALDFLSLGC